MHSALYVGRVRHRRFGGVGHAFTYGVTMAYLDLEELEPGGPLARLLDATPRALLRFERSDYLGDPGADLRSSVLDLVEARTGRRPAGPVRLLTNLRSAGWNFNPISLYYCFAPGGASGSDAAPPGLEAVVAEVTNTPWGERATYVLSPTPAGPIRARGVEKSLHVSPFLSMDLSYDIDANVPGRRCDVRFEVSRAGVRVFDADLWCTRRELPQKGGYRLAGQLRLMPLKVSAAIYFEAARLAVKGVAFVAHPSPRAGSGLRGRMRGMRARTEGR